MTEHRSLTKMFVCVLVVRQHFFADGVNLFKSFLCNKIANQKPHWSLCTQLRNFLHLQECR